MQNNSQQLTIWISSKLLSCGRSCPICTTKRAYNVAVHSNNNFMNKTKLSHKTIKFITSNFQIARIWKKPAIKNPMTLLSRNQSFVTFYYEVACWAKKRKIIAINVPWSIFFLNENYFIFRDEVEDDNGYSSSKLNRPRYVQRFLAISTFVLELLTKENFDHGPKKALKVY